MGEPTNPRKIYETGGNWVVSLPKDWARENDLGPGTKVTLEATTEGFEATRVVYRRASDV